jgi:hypothetical protein
LQNIIYNIRDGDVYCPANLPMTQGEKVTSKKKGLANRQYGRPIHWRKDFQRQYLLCPAGHPKFLEQKVCNVLFRLTTSIRSQIPYGTDRFAEVFRQRTAIERTYSRLLTITMQHPTVRGLQANKNYYTVTHIAILLVAATAAKMGELDKVRWIRSFVPNFLKT